MNADKLTVYTFITLKEYWVIRVRRPRQVVLLAAQTRQSQAIEPQVLKRARKGATRGGDLAEGKSNSTRHGRNITLKQRLCQP